MHLAYAVQVDAEQIESGLRFLRTEFGHEEASEECMKATKMLRKRALAVSTNIRSAYGFPERQVNAEWEPQDEP